MRSWEDQQTPGAVRMQEDVGLQSATDGEFRRASWHMDFIYQLGGVTKVDEKRVVPFVNESGKLECTPPASRVVGHVQLDHTIFGDDFVALKSMVTKATPKLTIPSPSMVHYRGGRGMINEEGY